MATSAKTLLAALVALAFALVMSVFAPPSAWADDRGVTDCPYDFDSNADGVADSWFFSADRNDAANQVYAYLADNGETLVVAGKGATVENIDGVQPDSDKKVSVNKSDMVDSLKTIRVEEGVTYLGANLVRNTKSISVELPASLEKMQISVTAADDSSYSALGNNYYDATTKTPSGIARISVADGNRAYKMVDGVLFSADGKTLLRYTNEAAAEYVVPSDVETIAAKAFARTEHLTKITMNEGLLTIGQDSFDKDSEITEVTIPSTVRGLGNAAFTACKNLETVTYLMTDYDSWKSQFNADDVSLKKVVFAEGLKSIPDELFSGNKTIESVELPSTLEAIGWHSFANCSNLKSLTREGVELEQLSKFTATEKNAYPGSFSNCTSLKSFPIAKSAPLKEVGAYVFAGSGIESFVAPDALETINESAFSGCAGLSSVEFNSALKSIEKNAFWKCPALQSLNITGAISNIASSAFAGDSGIGSISICSNGDLTIGGDAFAGAAASSVLVGSAGGDVSLKTLGAGGNATAVKIFGNNVDFQSAVLPTTPTGSSPWHTIDLTGAKSVTSSLSEESANQSWIWYLGAAQSSEWLNRGIIYVNDSDAQVSLAASLNKGTTKRPHIEAVTNGGTFPAGTNFEGGVLATPVKEGYSFNGWYDNAGLSGNPVTTAESGKIYYASWTKVVAKPVPAADQNLVYNGADQTYKFDVAADDENYCDIKGNVAKDAGEYTATASLANGATWDDGTTADLTFGYSIAKAKATVSFDGVADGAVTATEGDADFTQTATATGVNNEAISLTYGSSNPAVAEVDQTGKIHIKSSGTTTITAGFGEQDEPNYEPASTTYELTVRAASATDPAGDNTGAGTQNDPLKTVYGNKATLEVKISAKPASDVSALSADAPEAEVVPVNKNEVGFYYNGTLLGSPVSYDAQNGTAAFEYDTTKQTIPAGSVQVVDVKFGGSDTLAPSDGKLYIEIAKAAQAPSFDKSEVSQHVGTFNNAISGAFGAIAYESSNAGVATVADDGAVTVVSPGKSVITATISGDEWHAGATASYTVVVAGHVFAGQPYVYDAANPAKGHWQVCKFDGCDVESAATAHRFGDWAVTKEATSTAAGEEARTCADCGYVETKTVAATGGNGKVDDKGNGKNDSDVKPGKGDGGNGAGGNGGVAADNGVADDTNNAAAKVADDAQPALVATGDNVALVAGTVAVLGVAALAGVAFAVRRRSDC